MILLTVILSVDGQNAYFTFRTGLLFASGLCGRRTRSPADIRTPVSDVCEHAVWRQRICLITDLESRSEGMMFSELPDVAISTGDANAMSADGLLFLFAKIAESVFYAYIVNTRKFHINCQNCYD